MNLIRFLCVLLLGACSAFTADAQEVVLEQAAFAYQQGAYDLCLSTVQDKTDFPSLILQAEARLARYSLHASPDPVLDLKLAELAARKALELQPDSVRSRFALIAVIGYRARKRSLFTGFRKGWASKGRKLIDESLQLQPENPWPHVLLGNWNLEILRRTSLRRAKFVGASIAEAISGCEQAVKLAPNDAKVSGQCGLAFLAARQDELEPYGWRALALAAQQNQQFDAFSCFRSQQASQILNLRETTSDQQAKALALQILLGKNAKGLPTDWPIQCAPSNPLGNAPASGLHIQD
jgi:hypothetical protein